ncbi:MAG: glutathione peroxidase [Saprospiraceae bacterium]
MFNFLSGQKKMPSDIHNIYDFKIKSLQGQIIDFSSFKGKKILIVNTASKCSFTPQYEGLEKLYKLYKDKIVIIGFPANDFLRQEPGNNHEIESFCQLNYGVSFPMSAKISVKGKKMHPLYLWLTNEKYNHYKDSKVTWNFQKYLLDEQGKLIQIFQPSMDPMDEAIIKAIQ